MLGDEDRHHPRQLVRTQHRAGLAAAHDQLAGFKGDAVALGALIDRMALDHRLQQGQGAVRLRPLTQPEGRAAGVGHHDLAESVLGVIDGEAGFGADGLEGALVR